MASTKDYLVGVVIGEGSFGRVVHARHKTSGKDVAIKVFDRLSVNKQPRMLQSIWNERKLLQKFKSSPFVVNLWGAFCDESCVYLVMECIMGGDLKLLIEAGLTKDKHYWRTTGATLYVVQLIRAVEFLHQSETIHADIKPDNILVTPQGKLQLADFGSAFSLKDNNEQASESSGPQQSMAETPVLGGTVDYASPELLHGTPMLELGPATDLWSVGCVLAAMQWGQSPFHAASEALATDAIMQYAKGTSRPAVLNEDSKDLADLPPGRKELILGLLNPQPQYRLEVNRAAITEKLPGRDAPFLPPEPPWMKESKKTSMRDGSRGWSAFLL